MAYDGRRIAFLVRERLNENPRVTLEALALEMGVSRHSINKLLKRHIGVSFRGLQAQLFVEWLEHRLDGHAGDSVKSLAYSIGYGSSQAFAKRVAALTGSSVTGLRRRRDATAP